MSSLNTQIVEILAPVIGHGLAQSAVAMQCKKMGILPEELSHEHITEFTERFEKVLSIFAGETIAKEITRTIQLLT
mgnify:CR=1 FL=1|jgi:hypothetical protein